MSAEPTRLSDAEMLAMAPGMFARKPDMIAVTGVYAVMETLKAILPANAPPERRAQVLRDVAKALMERADQMDVGHPDPPPPPAA
jgi:hypothetical protein